LALLLDTLHSVDFMRAAPDEAVVRFMVLGKSADFPKGHVFWRPGSDPCGVVIPVSGEAKSASLNEDGRELIHRLAGTGATLGLPSALDGLPHPTSVEVVRKGEFFVIAREAFLTFLREHPAQYPAAVRSVCNGFRRNVEERQQIALMPVPERIAHYLVDHACLRQGDGARVLIEATQAEIAARVGTVREVVARTFADFIERGLIEKTAKGIFVADWNALCAQGGIDPFTEMSTDPDNDSAVVRTARFFLSAREAKRVRTSQDPSVCAEHLGDLSQCAQRGCPAGDYHD
jgi:CRP/FNR family transcriptional regulator